MQGREFTAADTDASPRVVVVNESFVRRYFPGENPIGKRIRPGLSTTEPDEPWREIVGVAADVKQVSLQDQPSPMFVVPHAQGMITTPHLVIRSAGALDAIPEAARRVVAAADPELAVYDVKTLADRRDTTMATQRFTTWLLTLFAGLGLLLTAVGLYGVLAYGVSRRRHEFGVRVALGASSRHIVATVVGRAFALVAAGLAIGVTASTALGRVMRAALDFVSPADASTYATVALILLVVATAAALVPVRRAVAVDPMQTLRSN